MLRSVWLTGGTSAAILVVNTVSGILIARILDPDGKGAVATITMWVQMGAWMFALGLPAATTYLVARPSHLKRSVVGTALAASAAFGVFAVAATQVLLLLVFSGQDHDIRVLAHVFGLATIVVVVADFALDLINGDHDFRFLNLLRFGRPAVKVVLFIALWPLIGFSVTSVLLAFALAEVVTAAIGVARAVRKIGVARPSPAILREALGYGLRLQGGQLAAAANHRLDILLMPAFISTAGIGLYSVAVSVASIVFSVVGTVGLVVFPMATRAAGERSTIIARSLRLVLVAAVLSSLPLFVFASALVPLVYGSDFGGAVAALRILLVGYVFKCGSTIIVAGLKAANRPLAASVGELSAIPITVIGLALVLEPHGIEGAAAVSTVAYGLSFLVGLVLFAGHSQMPIGTLISPRGLVGDLLVLARRGHHVPRDGRVEADAICGDDRPLRRSVPSRARGARRGSA